MAHAQQQILDAVAAAIVAGATAAGARVFVDRVDPLLPTELPAVTVDEGESGEEVQSLSLDGAVQMRELSVRIGCVVKGAASAAAARELGLGVEKVLVAAAGLRELCSADRFHIESSVQVNNGDGDRLLAGRVQTWRFSYAVQSASPDTFA
jgi:hypothetical protein